ncbi:DUF309 domain-containing protein [Paenibacillus ihumii]|uniref:DUF309 domain-containing protein n=1 Tax=Paenibacillus ihumii TaxID=687436 RepID=UPI0006D7A5B4|nr:DUF309 domain-containing protein [Paenibacillus ihumii]
MTYDRLYVAFLVYFNRDRDYFECHEVMEELWLKLDKDPLHKGLLQVAVGLYHFRNGNVTGGRKMMESAAQRLAPYPPDSLGIDLGKLLRETEAYAAALANYDESPFPYYDLTIDILDSHLSELVDKAAPEIEPNIPQRRGPQRGAKHELRMQGRSE